MQSTKHDHSRHHAADSQLTFFEPGGYQPPAPKAPPFVASSDTSKAAARRIKPAAQRLRRLVFDFICSHDGATDQEIAAGLDLLPDTARARRCELRDSGHVADSGQRRMTSRGRPAAVWTTTGKPFGEA